MQKTFNQSAYFFIKHVQHHHPTFAIFASYTHPKSNLYFQERELNYNNINQQIYHELLYLFFNE